MEDRTVLRRMFSRIPALHPLGASGTQLQPSPHPHPVVTTKNISRRCQMTPRNPNWPWLQTTVLWPLTTLPTVPTTRLQFFRTPKLSCLSASALAFSVPGMLSPLFLGTLFFLSILALSETFHDLALSISSTETCFFHRTRHGLIFFVVYLHDFLPYLTVNPLRLSLFYSSLFPLHLAVPCHLC